VKKIKLFISSVQKEFAEEREAIFCFIQNDPLLGLFFEPFLFENLPAIDQNADIAYIKKVAETDIYIGLIGSDYGFENANGLSPTEIEFDEATKQHKTRFIYLKGNDIELHPKTTKFIQKIGLNVIRKRFNTIAELNSGIYASLVYYLKEKEYIRTCPFDAAYNKATFDDLDNNKISAFIARAKLVRNFPLSPASSVEETLTHLNLLTDGKITNAAILLFGKEPQRFIFGSEVKCAHFHGTEVAKPIPFYQIYKGDVFELVDKCVDFVLSKLNFSVGTREQFNQIPTSYEIPRAVVSEAIVNAIAHRDYSSNGSVQVMLFSDRLEIWNPGTLPSTLTIQKLKAPHGSVPVNPLIAEPMYLAGYIEKLGSGIRDMFRLCKETGLKEPEFSLYDGFKTIIWRNNQVILPTGQVTVQVPEEIKRLVLVISGELKRAEIQKILDLKNVDFFRENYINPSLEAGYVEMLFPENPNHPQQRYTLTEKGKVLKIQIEKGFTVAQTSELTYLSTDQVTGQVPEEIKRLVLVISGELKRAEIQKNLDLKNIDFFRENYLNPSLKAGYIDMLFPESPNHPQQRYKLTEKGKKLKKFLERNKKN